MKNFYENHYTNIHHYKANRNKKYDTNKNREKCNNIKIL